MGDGPGEKTSGEGSLVSQEPGTSSSTQKAEFQAYLFQKQGVLVSEEGVARGRIQRNSDGASLPQSRGPQLRGTTTSLRNHF